MSQLDFGCGLAIKEVALHFPVTQVEVSLRATVEARTIRAPTVGKRAAHVSMPATKYSRHEIAYLCHLSPLVGIALVCITRSDPPNWATQKAKELQ